MARNDLGGRRQSSCPNAVPNSTLPPYHMRLDALVCAITLAASVANAVNLDARRERRSLGSADSTGASAGTLVGERQLYLNAARTAWAFVDRNYQPSTGLARAHDPYQYVTIWDVGSALAATYSAHELGLITDAAYGQRIQRALATLSAMDLFDGAAFNKSYDSRTGRMIDRRERISSKGYGWSTTDIGRLLIWLRILAVNQPQFAPAAGAIARRLNVSRLIADGYLQGSDLDPRTGGLRAYPEGRIGYEQYAAAGFALWGFRADKALDGRLNALPVDVLGISIVADRRGDERITSEPYIMMGMETGWYSPELREQAWRLLGGPEKRYKNGGTFTIAAEAALPRPPHIIFKYHLSPQCRAFPPTGPPG